MSQEHVETYAVHLKLPRTEITLYELEHPEYETEQDFVRIMGIWERERASWTRMNGEMCPRPKKRPGRPHKVAEAQPKKAVERQGPGGTLTLTFKIPEDVLVAIVQVKGELTVAECVVQLLRHALSLSQEPTDGVTAK